MAGLLLRTYILGNVRFLSSWQPCSVLKIREGTPLYFPKVRCKIAQTILAPEMPI